MLDNKWVQSGIVLILLSPFLGWACYCVGVYPFVACIVSFVWLVVGMMIICMADE